MILNYYFYRLPDNTIMRYTKRLTYWKTKCIFVAIIVHVSLMTGALLKLHVVNSTQQRTTVISKSDFSNNYVPRQRDQRTEFRDDVLDEYFNEYFKDTGSHNGTMLSKLTRSNLRIGSQKELLLSDQVKHPDDSEVVFFIGGHKCGSTTLATYLKHDPNNWGVWDPNGQFMDGEKELCWSLAHNYQSRNQFWQRFKTHGSKTAIFALDACPTAIGKIHFERMVKSFPNASYLMLIRDPVDRVISAINTWIEEHGKGDESIDYLLRNLINQDNLGLKSRSMFGRILQNAFSVLPRNKILIVPNPDLKRQPQHTIDKVMRHIGARPKNVTLVESNKRKDKTYYQIPSNMTITWLRDMFFSDWELFKNISRVHVDTVYM